MASLESGRWVGEERYEMVGFSPAVRNIRLEKEATSGAFRSELFRGETSFIMCTILMSETQKLVKVLSSQH